MAKVTISQIAKEAGVSKTAVSFAFNDPSQLASSTVHHIHVIAERMGYTPDPITNVVNLKSASSNVTHARTHAPRRPAARVRAELTRWACCCRRTSRPRWQIHFTLNLFVGWARCAARPA